MRNYTAVLGFDVTIIFQRFSMRKTYIDKTIKFPLFRFTKKKWSNCFFSSGQLRLGTLFDYAMNESYGEAVHDKHEGYYVRKLPEDKWINGKPSLHLVLARNNLLLCSSTQYDESLYEEFDADCCIRIDSIEFFNAIDKVLQKEFTALLLRKVIYYDKSSLACAPSNEDFAGVMKNYSFSSQCEVRALWEPQPKEPRDYDMYKSIKPIPGLHTENSLINVSETEWYQAVIKKESKLLKPKTIFVPEAVKYCTLIQKKKA